MIHIENLTYRYPDNSTFALQNINLIIKSGESLAVMGGNGSGKSTFTKIIASLIKADRGKCEIQSNSILPVGMIFQNPDNQFVAMTVEKELAFTMENLGWDHEKIKNKIEMALAEFQLTEYRKRLISELSGGEKQRLAIASVMAVSPDILILDEPDSFLDKNGQQILFEQLKYVKQENQELIVIHVTQYKAIAKKYSRMLVFYEGEIVADEAPEKIFSNKFFLLKTKLDYQRSGTQSFDTHLIKSEQPDGNISLNVQNLKFGYIEPNDLYHALSFNIERGKITAVVGESGSGKSTLVSIINKLIDVEEKTLSIVSRNSDVREVKSSDAASMFQQPERQFFLPTVKEEIQYGPQNKKRTLSESEIKSYLNLVGLKYSDIAERDPITLSGGEKRRLAFAVVLALQTDFILFDEPTCGLDPHGVGLFAELVENLKLLNKGIIIVSHDYRLVSKIGDSFILLSKKSHPKLLSKSDFLSYSQEFL